MDYTVVYKDINGAISVSVKDGNTKVSPHFTVSEFAVNQKDGTDIAFICEYTVRVLEGLRTLIGHPVQITSAGRTPFYNKRVGGADGSMHRFMFGVVDFILDYDISLQDKQRVIDYFINMGFKGIGVYNRSLGVRMHVDFGYRDKLTMW